MEAKIDTKTNTLTITLPLAGLHPSKSGKTLIVASSNGNQAVAAEIDGKPIVVGVNAYIKR
jgi:hypothetical protein